MVKPFSPRANGAWFEEIVVFFSLCPRSVYADRGFFAPQSGERVAAWYSNGPSPLARGTVPFLSPHLGYTRGIPAARGNFLLVVIQILFPIFLDVCCLPL